MKKHNQNHRFFRQVIVELLWNEGGLGGGRSEAEGCACVFQGYEKLEGGMQL